MVLQILFVIIFFVIGAWFGYNKSREEFGTMMEQGMVMYKSLEFGWLGHPNAFKEIREQEHELSMAEAVLIKGAAEKALKETRKGKK